MSNYSFQLKNILMYNYSLEVIFFCSLIQFRSPASRKKKKLTHHILKYDNEQFMMKDKTYFTQKMLRNYLKLEKNVSLKPIISKNMLNLCKLWSATFPFCFTAS